MFDVGLGELIILAVIGLLVFGPERLPKAAADGARMLRNLRAMASNARKDLSDSAGVDLTDARDALREIQQLHPRRMVADMFTDDPATERPGGAGAAAVEDPSAGKGSAPGAERTPPRYDPDAT